MSFDGQSDALQASRLFPDPRLNEAAGAADASRATLRESCRNVVSWFSVFVFVSFWQLPLIQSITAKSRLKSHRAASAANATGFLQTLALYRMRVLAEE